MDEQIEAALMAAAAKMEKLQKRVSQLEKGLNYITPRDDREYHWRELVTMIKAGKKIANGGKLATVTESK